MWDLRNQELSVTGNLSNLPLLERVPEYDWTDSIIPVLTFRGRIHKPIFSSTLLTYDQGMSPSPGSRYRFPFRRPKPFPQCLVFVVGRRL